MSMPQNVTISCQTGSGYDPSDLGIRISSIFTIGIGSLLGVLLPIALARTKKMHVPPLAFFITKYFGSGVIVATAFIHLLAPAIEALTSPCLSGPITEYSWVEGIVLITIFMMLFIEMMAARSDVFGTHDHNHGDNLKKPEVDLEMNGLRSVSRGTDGPAKPAQHHHHHHPTTPEEDSHSNFTLVQHSSNTSRRSVAEVSHPASRVMSNRGIPGREDDFSYPPGGEDHLGHSRSHDDADDHFAAQMTAIFILEFGVIFHSIFIGLTLAVTGSNFKVLYIVLAFHQTFEGLGLGSRLATADWPAKKWWMPWTLGIAFGLCTPIAIAVGLAVHSSFDPTSSKTLIVQGIFDSISAGILIYTGLVELMAHEFMFNPEIKKGKMSMVMFAYGSMCLGAFLMAVLGKWA